MIEDVVQNTPPVIIRLRVEQRLGSNAVREDKNDAQHSKVQQLDHLQYIANMLNVLEPVLETTETKMFRPRRRSQLQD